jgi:hypothetical protein
MHVHVVVLTESQTNVCPFAWSSLVCDWASFQDRYLGQAGLLNGKQRLRFDGEGHPGGGGAFLYENIIDTTEVTSEVRKLFAPLN